MLARAVAKTLLPGDTLIVSSAGHEANIGPWVRAAAAARARVAWWHPAGPNGEDTCPLDALNSLLAAAEASASRVRVVAFPHVSNLLGGVTDVAAIARTATGAGALTVCDGVAFAPHGALDVRAWGLDFYALSLYKTYGPHAGALYGAAAAWRGLRAAGGAPNHAFITADAAAADADDAAPWYVWELGGVCHEGAAALAGLRPYLAALARGGGACEDANGHGAESGGAKSHVDEAEERRLVRAAFARMPALEAPVQALFSAYFSAAHAARRLRLLGPRDADADTNGHDADGDANGHASRRVRVPTFSFVPTAPGVTPAAVVAACFAARVAVRHGHMYAPRLLRRLNVPIDAHLPPDDDADAVADAGAHAGVAPPAHAAAGGGGAYGALLGGGGGGGVVRVSAVHYNTLAEAQRCIDAIDAALGC
jgi:selenocysteine lyase/cysteine desulfurase